MDIGDKVRLKKSYESFIQLQNKVGVIVDMQVLQTRKFVRVCWGDKYEYEDLGAWRLEKVLAR